MSNAHGLSAQVEYWNRVGPTKPLAHPVNIAQLSRWAPPPSRILDYGCGYGRALGFLQSKGYRNLIGVDPAAAMICTWLPRWRTAPRAVPVKIGRAHV